MYSMWTSVFVDVKKKFGKVVLSKNALGKEVQTTQDRWYHSWYVSSMYHKIYILYQITPNNLQNILKDLHHKIGRHYIARVSKFKSEYMYVHTYQILPHCFTWIKDLILYS